MVLPHEGRVSLQKHDPPLRTVWIAAASVMDENDRRVRQETNSKKSNSVAQIDFLGVHEEPGIEAADGAPNICPDEHERSRDDLNCLWSARVDAQRAAPQFAQAACDKQNPKGRKHRVVRPRVWPSFSVDAASPPRGGVRVGLGESHKSREFVADWNGIWIE